MPQQRSNPRKRELTLKDRLSRLNYAQACKLLGPNADRLIRRGGAFNICIDQQVFLGDDLFRLSLDGAVVTITLMAQARLRLHWNCTRCHGACEHVGAAFSLILEEKVALGLAIPPPERAPIESLSESELVERAMAEREDRSRKERMSIRSTNSRVLWTDYKVTNPASGKTYRVALRGWEPGDSYCTCPDFRKNTLGVCKHILALQRRIKKRFSPATRRRPYRQREIAVHIRYGKDLELRLLRPENLNPTVEKIIRPISDKPITNVRDLVRRIGQLEAQGCDVTIYPDAEEFINEKLFQNHMTELVASIRKNPARHPLRRTLLKTELLPYQLDGIAFAAGIGRAILADDMGLGKTVQSIGVAELLHREANIRRVLVICPASVKTQWRHEIERFSNRHCQLVMGSAHERAQQYSRSCFFTVCNYEQVLRDVLSIERASWDLIILDEGQRIKNWEAKTSRVIKALRSRFALVLSGTPLENRLDELYSVVEFIDDRRLGPAFRFFNRHRVVDENGKVLGYKNLVELRKQLKPVLLRRTRAGVMRDLPPRSTEIIRIAPTDEQLGLHASNLRIVSSIVRKPYVTEMDFLRLRKALLMCRLAANSTYLVDKTAPGYSSKLDVLDDLLGTILAEADRKIVLFSEWTTMLELIEPLLKKYGAQYVRLDGSIPQKRRQTLVRRFQENADCRVFVTTNAGATGLNLQSANTVINVDLPWNPAVLEQRIARAHRMGQNRPVQVYVLVTEETIEEGLLKTLSDKHELALAALDADSDVDEIDFISGTNELKNRLELLLGRMPDSPIDASEHMKQHAAGTQQNGSREVGVAAGELLGAAFSFDNRLLPATPARDTKRQQIAQTIHHSLSQCMTQDSRGHVTLTVALPDQTAAQRLSESLASLLSTAANCVVSSGNGSQQHGYKMNGDG